MSRRPRPSARLCAAIALLAVSQLACAGGPAAGQRFKAYPQATVVVESQGGSHEFRAWVADTDARRQQGLMFVERLDAGEGMLFLFDGPQFAAFWMKDTPLSLDILFIGPDGRITNIGERTQPLSTKPVSSMRPVVAVLELAAGTAARLGIRPGDRVVHPAYDQRTRR